MLTLFLCLAVGVAADAPLQVAAVKGASAKKVLRADRGSPFRVGIAEHAIAGPLWLDCWGPADAAGEVSCRWSTATAAELESTVLGGAVVFAPFVPVGGVVHTALPELENGGNR